MEFTNVFLSVFFLFISKVIANEESRGYLRREHSIFKGELKCFPEDLTNMVSFERYLLRSQPNLQRNVTLMAISCGEEVTVLSQRFSSLD